MKVSKVAKFIIISLIYITCCNKQQLVVDLYSHDKAAVSLPFSSALLTALCDPSRHSLMGSKACWGAPCQPDVLLTAYINSP